MARRKRQMMDDDDSSDASGSDGGGFDDPTDPTEREERAMFDDPYGRKRRKTNGKEDALYGVFADDSDDDERTKKAPGKSRAQTAKSRAKAPVFVSGDSKAKVELDAAMAVDGDGEASSDEDGDAEEDEDDEPDESGDEDEEMDNSTRAPSPRIQTEEEPSQRARFGGIGSGGNAQSNAGFSGFSKGGIGSGSQASGFTKGGIGSKPREADLDAPTGPSKGGIGSRSQAAGFTKGGIGASASVPAFSASSSASTPARAPSPLPASASVPSAFGGARAQAQRSFVRHSEPSSGASTPLPAHERAHFSKLTGFGAKMLEKMGWQAGQGLGTTGEGIVIPVESKLRPKGMGIAFNNFREKTEQSKMEARRRGEVVSDDEEDKPKRGKRGAKGAEKEAKKGDAWKKPKRVKTKIEHKTYEQIVAEAGIEPSTSSGIGQIFDATSGTVSTLLSNWLEPIADKLNSYAKYHHLRIYRPRRGRPRRIRRASLRCATTCDSSRNRARATWMA